MELSVGLGFRSQRLSPFRQINFSVLEHPLKNPLLSATRLTPKPTLRLSKSKLTVAAKKKFPIEGLSDDLNAVARQNLDFATSRRRVRNAFIKFQENLDHCLFKTFPAGIRTEEWYERNSRGLEIFCKSWMPRPGVPIKAALCFCHGYGDTCTYFFEGIAKKIAGAGYAVYAMDYPGFGLSEGLHGYVPNFDNLVDDVIEHYTQIKARPEIRELPHFILGQSMGGAVTLKVHLTEPNNWDGVVLVAPMCKDFSFNDTTLEGLISNQIGEGVLPSDAVLKVMSVLSKVIPKAKLFPETDISELFFREPSKRKFGAYNVIAYEDQTRLRTGMELLRATQELESQVQKVSAPLLILHGGSDKVTDPKVSKFLYEKASSKDKTLKLYEGGYHCILEGEPDDRIFTVLNDIISWLDSRSSVK